MNLTNIWNIITKVIDICFVWLAFYYILKNVKNNTKMALIVKGVFIVIIIKFVSDLLNLYTVGVILEYAISLLLDTSGVHVDPTSSHQVPPQLAQYWLVSRSFIPVSFHLTFLILTQVKIYSKSAL